LNICHVIVKSVGRFFKELAFIKNLQELDFLSTSDIARLFLKIREGFQKIFIYEKIGGGILGSFLKPNQLPPGAGFSVYP